MEIEIQGIPIHYETFGDGRPIVMLHGYNDDHRIMIGCMEPIFQKRTGWQRIYFDLPGRGKTPGPAWMHNHDQMLQVISDFIARLLPGQSFTIAGLSHGGYLAQGLVYQQPNLIEGALFIAPEMNATGQARLLEDTVTLVQEPIEGIDPNCAGIFNYLTVVQTQHVYDRWRDELYAGFQVHDREFVGKFPEDTLFSFDPTVLPEPFIKPCLILTGRQDNIVGYRNQLELLPSYPHATFAILDHAAHTLQFEQEAVFNALVNEWLDRMERSLGAQDRN